MTKKTTLPNTPGRKAAQFKYNHQPEQIKRRAERNRARAILAAKGEVHKGDGKDVDHKNHDTADESNQNLRVQSLFVNRRNNRPGKKGVTKPRG